MHAQYTVKSKVLDWEIRYMHITTKDVISRYTANSKWRSHFQVFLVHEHLAGMRLGENTLLVIWTCFHSTSSFCCNCALSFDSVALIPTLLLSCTHTHLSILQFPQSRSKIILHILQSRLTRGNVLSEAYLRISCRCICNKQWSLFVEDRYTAKESLNSASCLKGLLPEKLTPNERRTKAAWIGGGVPVAGRSGHGTRR